MDPPRGFLLEYINDIQRLFLLRAAKWTKDRGNNIEMRGEE